MSAVGERGGSRISALLWLVFFAAVIYAVFNVAPVYIDHYNLVDKMNEMARQPRWNNPDDVIVDKLMKVVREERIPGIQRTSFTVSTVETSRQITVNYTRPAEVVPGWKHTFKFSSKVDQPLIY